MVREFFIRKVFTRRSRFFGWVAVCLLLTTVGNAAFLHHHQCGESSGASIHNETASEHQHSVSEKKSILIASEDGFLPSMPDDEPNSQQCNDCFCASFHILTGSQLDFSRPLMTVYEKTHSFFQKLPRSDSHLQSLFHPPLLA